jgi:hypothetical protein
MLTILIKRRRFKIQLKFVYRGSPLTRGLLNQGVLLAKLKSLLRKLYGRHPDFVDRYGISVLQMTTDMFHIQ